VKNTPQSTKIAGDDGTISVIVTKRVLGEEGCRHPRQQDSQPFPKTPSDTPCIFWGVCGAGAARIVHHKRYPKYQQFHVNRT
jgi:hypothetical protein